MGSKVQANCQCGLNKGILIGCGMLTFANECFFPCICKNCNDVVEVNLLDETPNCPICKSEDVIPYDHISVIGELGNKIVNKWNANKLGR